MNDPLPGPPLRIAVLGDFDGPHTRSWIGTFVQRGHEVHAISYYPPRVELPGVILHVLSQHRAPSQEQRSSPGQRDALSPGGERVRERGRGSVLQSRAPSAFLRYLHAWRYRRAGLRRVLDEIRPDVFHAHYAVEHGFYGAVGYHPYVVSAWGSDLLVEARSGLNRRIACKALLAADLVTGNDASLVKRAIELGVPPEKATVVHLGIERLFLEAGAHSVNLDSQPSIVPIVISDRALERLYNTEVILLALIALRKDLPGVHLLIAGDGSEHARLANLVDAYDLTGAVEFLGRVNHAQLSELLARGHVYVSVPSSDSFALSNLEAMAAGVFPIVSDLPSVDGWIDDGVNGLRVPPRNVEALADAIVRALKDAALRHRAALHNRRLVEARGLREPNMLLMERHYYRLAGHPVEERGAI